MKKDELRKRVTSGKGARLLQQTISLSDATDENKLLRLRSSWNPNNELRAQNKAQIPATEKLEENILYKGIRDRGKLKEMAPEKTEEAMQSVPARILRSAMRAKGPKTGEGKFDEFEDTYTLAISTLILGEISHLQSEMNEIHRQEEHPVDRGMAVTSYVMSRLGGSIQKLMSACQQVEGNIQTKNPGGLSKIKELKQNPAAYMTFLGELIDETINDVKTGPVLANMLETEIPKLEVDVKDDVEKKRTEGIPFHSGIHGKKPG